MILLNYRQIAQETVDITARGEYLLGDTLVKLGDYDFKKVEVISLQKAAEYALNTANIAAENNCRIIVDNADSFEAARVHGVGKSLVLNFANAYYAGGGFLYGAQAQEESLCRCSTLYASLSGEAAGEMYAYNKQNNGPGGSDYMLLSPDVVVFRDGECQLLAQPFHTSVITSAAPNLRGDTSDIPMPEVEEIFCRKIKNIASVAAVNGYDTLILGAWGCGVFRNDAGDVARYFHNVLVRDGMQRYFKKIVFAVYASRGGYNLEKFQEQFS